jgi:hypothetical protein
MGICGGRLTRINIIQARKAQELRNQRPLNRHKQRAPRHHRRHNTNRISLVSLVPSIASPFKPPMYSAQETQDRSSVPDLQRFDQVEQVCSVLLGDHEAVAGVGVVEFPGEVDGRERGCEVGQCASEAHVVCFAGNFGEGECVFDRSLPTADQLCMHFKVDESYGYF